MFRNLCKKSSCPGGPFNTPSSEGNQLDRELGLLTKLKPEHPSPDVRLAPARGLKIA